MKELEKTFTGRAEVRGFKFTQVSRSDRGYLYRVDSTDFTHHYEVFERRENKQYDCVTYPSSKVFGRYAWTYRDYIRAMERFEKL